MLQEVSPLLSSRGRFSSSELKAHRSGAKLSFCQTTATLWRGAHIGSNLLPRPKAARTWFVLVSHKAPQLPASLPSSYGAGRLHNRLWVRPHRRTFREICLSDAGTRCGTTHEDTGFSTRAANRTRQAKLKSEQGLHPRQTKTELNKRSSVVEVRGSKTTGKGCETLHTVQRDAAKPVQPTVTSSPFSFLEGLFPRLCLAQALAQDTPLDATELGKDIWQRGCTQGPSSTSSWQIL